MSNKPNFIQELEGRFPQNVLDQLTGDASKDVLFLLQQLAKLDKEIDECSQYYQEVGVFWSEAEDKLEEVLELVQLHAEAGNIDNYDFLCNKIEEVINNPETKVVKKDV